MESGFIEEPDKKTSVSLIVGQREYVSYGTHSALILAHRRGLNDSWPGGYQATVHGGVKVGEALETALLREVEEELGTPARWLLYEIVESKIFELCRTETPTRTVITFGLWLWPSEVTQLQRVKKPEDPTSGIVLLSELAIARSPDLRIFDKKKGVEDRRVCAFFPDEKDAILRFFKTH